MTVLKSMDSSETYEVLAHVVRGVLGDWEAAASHLRKLGWTAADWESWVNECECGSSATPELGLAIPFAANADFLGLARSLRGSGDDVATCLACVRLWVALDPFVPDGQRKVLDLLVERLASAQSSAA